MTSKVAARLKGENAIKMKGRMGGRTAAWEVEQRVELPGWSEEKVI